MRALLVTADLFYADTLGRDLAGLPDPVEVLRVSSGPAALDHLGAPGIDAAVLDFAHPPGGMDLGTVEQLRRRAATLPVIALVGPTEPSGLDVVAAGADGFLRRGEGIAQPLARLLSAAVARARLRARPALRVMYVSRSEAVRDPALAARLDLEVVTPATIAPFLPAAFASGPLAFDAFVVDLSGGADDLLTVAQDLIIRGGGVPLVVLTDAGDRRVAQAAIQIGAHQVVARAGAWPVHLGAALDLAVLGRRARLEIAVVRGSEARLRLLVESLPVGVAVIAQDGTILAMNAAGLDVAGADRPDGIVRTSVFDRVASDDHDAIRRFLGSVADGGRKSVRARWRVGAAMRWIDLTGVVLERSATGARAVLAALRALSETEGAPPESVGAAASTAEPSAPVHAAEALPVVDAGEVRSLRERLAQAETAQAERAEQLEREISTLRDALALAVQEAHDARASVASSLRQQAEAAQLELRRAQDAQRAALQSRAEELDRLREALAKAEAARSELEAARQADADTRRSEVETLSEAIETAERAKAALIEEHRAALDGLRAAFREREVAQAAAVAALEVDLVTARQQRDAAQLQAQGRTAAWRERLEAIEARERRIFENELVGIAVTTAGGEIVRANAVFQRMFGARGADVLRRLPEQWVRATTSLDTLAPLASEGRLPVTEGAVVLESGEPLWYLESAFIVSEEGGARTHIERWFADVSARHALAASRRERTGVEAVGRVAGEFVREVDGLVSDVHRLARTALERLDPREAKPSELRDALERASRAHQITQQFLAFSRSRVSVPDSMPLGAALATLAPLLQELTGQGIRLEVDAVPESLHARTSRESLTRALMSLVASAAESLPVGGSITLRTSGLLVAPDAPDAAQVCLTLDVSGFGGLPLHEPPGVDATLAPWGGSLQVVQDESARAYVLTVPAIERLDARAPDRANAVPSDAHGRD